MIGTAEGGARNIKHIDGRLPETADRIYLVWTFKVKRCKATATRQRDPGHIRRLMKISGRLPREDICQSEVQPLDASDRNPHPQRVRLTNSIRILQNPRVLGDLCGTFKI
jgi:hypothetical protein